MSRVLVVGAGFAGAVVARELADRGIDIDLIDRRDHLAGNAYDPVDAATGIRVHRYGPHIFHTNDRSIVDWLSRFTGWLPYRHRVEAYVDGVGHVPLPINRTTLNLLYGLALRDEAGMRAYLDGVRARHPRPANAREAAENLYGAELTELFFGRYSRKMWALDLADLPASVVARLPVRYDDNPEYFDDAFQAMPDRGYGALFANMLDHDRIRVRLATPFARGDERGYDHVFTSAAIDEWFDLRYGPLPYRSIRFAHRVVGGHGQPVPTVNLTDTSPVTRRTDWRMYPGHGSSPSALLTCEMPCSYEDNAFERYYPAKRVDGVPQERYARYRALADALPGVTFIGRCGQYQYFDMHQVVGNSRAIARRFLATAAAA